MGAATSASETNRAERPAAKGALGLPHLLARGAFLSALTHRLHKAEGAVAVAIVNVDGFHAINADFGLAVGNGVLRAIGARLTGALSGDEVAGRLGGDEFAIVSTSEAVLRDLELFATRLQSTLAPAMEIGGRTIHVSASIGVAKREDASHGAEILLACADRLMRQAKQESRGSFRIDASRARRQETGPVTFQDLKRAVERGEINLALQPLFGAKDLDLQSAEVLARWRHGVLGNVPPAVFVELAENTGLILELGGQILTRSIEMMARREGLRLAVNVSPVQFRRHGFALRVQDLLHANKVAPDRLEIEVTENALISDSDVPERTVRQLRDVGVHVALDDFGIGYSSLSYLQRLVFDKVKLDQSFVRGLTQKQENSRLVRAIIDLGHSLGMSVVAEGVETNTQIGLLQLLGCDLLQGYALGVPCPETEFCSLYMTKPEPIAAAPTSLRRTMPLP